MNYDHIYATAEEDFVDRSVGLLSYILSESIADNGQAILGLSGGSTPKVIYEALGMSDTDWSKVTLFLVDDRYIPADADGSNQKLVRETLLKNANIPEENLIFPNTTLPIEECVTDYETRLAMTILQGIPHSVTLGLGSDGHIASLFPPLSEAAYGDRLVLHTETDQFDVHDRISTTMAVIGSANRKVFFLKGAEKKAVWEEMLADDDDPLRWPAKAALQLGGGVVISAFAEHA